MHEYKTCTRCKQTKELADFNKRAVSKDGYRPSCRACDAVDKKDYYSRNPQKYNHAARKTKYKDLPADQKAKKIASTISWNRANKSKRTLAMAKRRALQKQNGIFLVSAAEISAIQNSRCFYCGMPGGEVDHVIPLTKGGTHSIGNLVSACRSCNSSKNNLFITEWRIKRGRPPTYK
jgi:5-methylcytosine-specific restriction endonuclease McrA